MSTTRQQEFWSGVRDEIPILLGVIPFGLIFGASAMASKIPAAAAQAMSSIIFAGSAQFIAAQLISASASGEVVLLVIFVVNLRHALYSASVSPYMSKLKSGWKYLLAYLLTDEAYAVTITHYNREGDAAFKHWYFLGAGLMLWTSWQISTAVGILIEKQIPQNLPLSFFLPLTFIALVIPALKDRASIIAAFVAAIIALAGHGLPYGVGLLLGGFVGIGAGMLVESRFK